MTLHECINPHIGGSPSPLDDDLALLDALTAPTLPKADAFMRRDAELDPLLLAAAAASGPHVTRNHYQHDFFPGVMLPKAEGAWDWSKWNGDEASQEPREQKRYTYVSRQGPRRQRLGESKENDAPVGAQPLRPADNVPLRDRAASLSHASQSLVTPAQPISSKDITVKCMARTRIPTPHGIAFLHLYHNNRDDKEHLAIVIDPAQLSEPTHTSSVAGRPIRSSSLDAVWSENETDMDRLTRGAYVGRLSPTSRHVSLPFSQEQAPPRATNIPAPLIRIHSECFTGETVGSMRCDCGEQLDEAIRLMAQPIPVTPAARIPVTPAARIPGRGVVVYLRQEGRGIGLLSKIRAYNLQDLGHDTVTANLLLGHKADERGYEVAVAILRDLGLGGADGEGEGVRLLTNNPDKVHALEKEGLRIVERVPMVPRSWRRRQHGEPVVIDVDGDREIEVEHERKAGATMVGGEAVHGEDLEKYLRTKVLRMGHMLSLHSEAS